MSSKRATNRIKFLISVISSPTQYDAANVMVSRRNIAITESPFFCLYHYFAAIYAICTIFTTGVHICFFLFVFCRLTVRIAAIQSSFQSKEIEMSLDFDSLKIHMLKPLLIKWWEMRNKIINLRYISFLAERKPSVSNMKRFSASCALRVWRTFAKNIGHCNKTAEKSPKYYTIMNVLTKRRANYTIDFHFLCQCGEENKCRDLP